MKTININSVYEMYKYNKGDLFEAYKAPSMLKIKSWRKIQDRMTKADGFDLVVRSRNCHKYTAMWRTNNKLFIEYPNRTEEYEIEGA